MRHMLMYEIVLDAAAYRNQDPFGQIYEQGQRTKGNE